MRRAARAGRAARPDRSPSARVLGVAVLILAHIADTLHAGIRHNSGSRRQRLVVRHERMKTP